MRWDTRKLGGPGHLVGEGSSLRCKRLHGSPPICPGGLSSLSTYWYLTCTQVHGRHQVKPLVVAPMMGVHLDRDS